MLLEISDNLLAEAQLSPQAFKLEIAVMLFEKDLFTLEQAYHFAEVGMVDFQKVLFERKIPMHYNVTDLEEDIQTLQKLNKKP